MKKLVFPARIWRRGNSLLVTIPANLREGLKESDWVCVAIIGPFKFGVPVKISGKLSLAVSEIEEESG